MSASYPLTSKKRSWLDGQTPLPSLLDVQRSRCLGLGLNLLLDLVLRQLLALHTLQELLHAVAGSVVGALGGEHHVHTTFRCAWFLHFGLDAICKIHS